MPDKLKRDMTDADRDEEIRFAGAGPVLDTEYAYPPTKWRGAPYIVEPVRDWPADVDKELAELKDRMRHLERILHKHINGEDGL